MSTVAGYITGVLNSDDVALKESAVEIVCIQPDIYFNTTESTQVEEET